MARNIEPTSRRTWEKVGWLHRVQACEPDAATGSVAVRAGARPVEAIAGRAGEERDRQDRPERWRRPVKECVVAVRRETRGACPR
jgi:hypothetical protein